MAPTDNLPALRELATLDEKTRIAHQGRAQVQSAIDLQEGLDSARLGASNFSSQIDRAAVRGHMSLPHEHTGSHPH